MPHRHGSARAAPPPSSAGLEWRWSSKAGEEVVLRRGRIDRAAHPLEGLQRPGLRPQHLAELEEPAVLRDLRSMGPHRPQLLVEEPADVQPGCDPVVGDGERRWLTVTGKPIFYAGPLHRFRHLPHQGFGKRRVIELAGTKRLAPREALDVTRVKERADRDPMGLDVIGVGVAAELVLGDHHLRPHLSHHLDQPADSFFFVGLPEGLRFPVSGKAGHARVLVTEENQFVDAENLDRVAQLGFANARQPGCGFLRVQILIQDFAYLTARGGDQRRAYAFRAVARQRAAHSDRLIVRMWLNRQKAELGRHHLPLRERTSWISCGTILWTSPTTPRSASLKIGASGSLLMAMMVLAPFIPTVCCMAPEIPSAM